MRFAVRTRVALSQFLILAAVSMLALSCSSAPRATEASASGDARGPAQFAHTHVLGLRPLPIPPPPPGLRILFVGNSLTGFNNLPGQFRAIANRNGQTPVVGAFIKFGQTLQVQLADKALQSELRQRWDFVVLQEYSNIPLVNFALFSQDIAAFKAMLAPSGAKIVLYENYPYTDSPAGTMVALDQAYAKVSQATGADIIPLGRAMSDITQSLGAPVTYAKADIKHPSPLASYMFALMFAKYFYKLSPLGASTASTTTNTVDVYSGLATDPVPADLGQLYTPAQINAVQTAADKFVN